MTPLDINWDDWMATPDFGAGLPSGFHDWVNIVVALLWYLAICWAVAEFIIGLGRFAIAKSRKDGVKFGESASRLSWSVSALIFLTGFRFIAEALLS